MQKLVRGRALRPESKPTRPARGRASVFPRNQGSAIARQRLMPSSQMRNCMDEIHADGSAELIGDPTERGVRPVLHLEPVTDTRPLAALAVLRDEPLQAHLAGGFK